MALLLVCVAIAVVGGVAVLVARDRPVLEDDPVEVRRLAWPPQGRALRPDDLGDARFTVTVRGYRMDEVDRVLGEAAAALAERDRRISELEGSDAARSAAGDSQTRPSADTAAGEATHAAE